MFSARYEKMQYVNRRPSLAFHAILASTFILILIKVVIRSPPAKRTELTTLSARFLDTPSTPDGAIKSPFSWYCKSCFSRNKLSRCAQMFTVCSRLGRSGLTVSSIPDSERSALITTCTKSMNGTHRIQDSIICGGLETLQYCHFQTLQSRCAVWEENSVIAIGITIKFVQYLKAFLLDSFKNSSESVPDEFNRQTDEFEPPETDALNSSRALNFFPKGRPFLHSFHGYFGRQKINEIVITELTAKLLSNSSKYDVDVHKPTRITATDAQINWSPAVRPCAACSGAVGFARSPSSVEIKISGPKLTRKIIVDRAIRKLRKQTDFKSLFLQNVEVQTIEKGNKKFQYIVRFSRYR